MRAHKLIIHFIITQIIITQKMNFVNPLPGTDAERRAYTVSEANHSTEGGV